MSKLIPGKQSAQSTSKSSPDIAEYAFLFNKRTLENSDKYVN